MKKLFKLAGLLGITFVLLVVALALAFYHLIQVGEFRRFLVSEIEKRTRLKANVGSADVRFGKVAGISFRDFALLEPETGRPVITSERVLVRLALIPLLERRLDFYEIRLYRPTLKVTRDQRGEVRLLELLLPPLSAGPDGSFTFDLRQIKIEKGEGVFFDQREGRAAAPMQFRDIDLTLRRLPVPASSDTTPEAAVGGGEARRGGQSVEYSLRATVGRDGSAARLKSRGKLAVPAGAKEWRQVSVEAETQIEALPVGSLWGYSGSRLPPRGARGVVASRLHWRGTIGQQLQIKGAVEFTGLEIDAPQWFATTFAPADARAEVEVEWRPTEIRLSRLDWRSDEISATLSGTLRRGRGDDPELDLRLRTPFLAVVNARKYVPQGAFGSPAVASWLDAMAEGEVSILRAGVAGRWSEIVSHADRGSIWLEAELHDVGGRLAGDGQLPWRGIGGRIIFEDGALHLKGIKGSYGNSRVNELSGLYRRGKGWAETLEIRARGELDFGEVHELPASMAVPSLARLRSQLGALDGNGTFDIALRKTGSSAYQVEGRLALENTDLRIGEFSFSQVRGELTLTPKEVRLDRLRGELAGSPVRASGTVGLTGGSAFDLQFDSPGIKAGLVTKMLLGSGSVEDPGTIRGAVRYQGVLVGDDERKLSGSLELVGVQYSLWQEPLRDLNGRLRFDSSGIEFQALKGWWAGSAFDFRGQWRRGARPQLVFALSSPEMDLGALLSRTGDGSGDWYDQLHAKGQVNIKKGKYEHFEFSDLRADLALNKRTWRLSNLSARSSGGTIHGSGSFTDGPQSLSFALESKVQGVPVKGLLGWFDMKTTEISGRVNLAGEFASSGNTAAERRRNLNGAFRLELEDGVVRRLRILVRILGLLDLSRWFTLQMPDVNQEGIRFRRITGDFKVSRGVYLTQNLLVDSDDLRLSGAGQIDGAEGAVDLVVAVRPFPRVTSAVSSIPLIGRGLAAIKNSFLVASFRVSGSLDKPIVIPAPLSTLSEFFFGALEIPKGLMGMSGEESK